MIHLTVLHDLSWPDFANGRVTYSFQIWPRVTSGRLASLLTSCCVVSSSGSVGMGSDPSFSAPARHLSISMIHSVSTHKAACSRKRMECCVKEHNFTTFCLIRTCYFFHVVHASLHAFHKSFSYNLNTHSFLIAKAVPYWHFELLKNTHFTFTGEGRPPMHKDTERWHFPCVYSLLLSFVWTEAVWWPGGAFWSDFDGASGLFSILG